jgi:regulator of sigma E protease
MDLAVQIGSIVLGVVILVFLVVVHELGHAIAARRSGVVVEEFGIGFPPAAWSRKLKNGVLFSVNWLPLGGFVKLQGEHDAATKPGDYGAASLWQKTRILLAGVAINWLTAAVLLTIVALMGMPKILPNQFVFGADTVTSTSPVLVASTVKDSPAQKAGLQKDDVLLSFAGQKMTDAYQLSQLTAANKGEKVDAVYIRKGVKNTVSIQLNASNAGGKGYLGAAAYQTQPTTYRSTWSAPIVGVGLAGQLSWETIKGLGTTVAQLGGGIASQISGDKAVRAEGSAELDKVSQGVAGPLGILGVIWCAAVAAADGNYFANACSHEHFAHTGSRRWSLVCDGLVPADAQATRQAARRKNPRHRLYDLDGSGGAGDGGRCRQTLRSISR